MLNNFAGAAFVDTYYRLSPAVANRVAESPTLAAVVRALLTALVLLSSLILADPVFVGATGVTLLVIIYMCRRNLLRFSRS